jgi:membrane-bound ClpP family serine protease
MTHDVMLLMVLLAAGVLLIGAEIFVPGAVLGMVGALALGGAVIVGFGIGETVGFYVLFGVVVTTALTVWVWIRYFPRSSIGRQMTLSRDGQDFKASDGHADLVGKRGVAHSELRPAGYALIEGRRIDVVTEGGLVASGETIEVVKARGSRVVVRKVAP